MIRYEAFINNVLIRAINVPFYIFSFLRNLVVITAVIRTPPIQRLSNIK